MKEHICIIEADMLVRQASSGEVVNRIFNVFRADAPQLFRILHAKVTFAKSYNYPILMLFQLCDDEKKAMITEFLEKFKNKKK